MLYETDKTELGKTISPNSDKTSWEFYLISSQGRTPICEIQIICWRQHFQQLKIIQVGAKNLMLFQNYLPSLSKYTCDNEAVSEIAACPLSRGWYHFCWDRWNLYLLSQTSCGKHFSDSENFESDISLTNLRATAISDYIAVKDKDKECRKSDKNNSDYLPQHVVPNAACTYKAGQLHSWTASIAGLLGVTSTSDTAMKVLSTHFSTNYLGYWLQVCSPHVNRYWNMLWWYTSWAKLIYKCSQIFFPHPKTTKTSNILLQVSTCLTYSLS